jgi:hypothetical protein
MLHKINSIKYNFNAQSKYSMQKRKKKTHTLTIFIKIYNNNISAKKVVQYYYKKTYTTCL